MEPKSERKAKNALREALASPGLPANGSGHGCDVSTTGAQSQQPFIAMTTLNSRLQLALLNRKTNRNQLEKGFTLVELMIVIVIVGILSAVALPNFLSQTEKAKATEAKTKMSALLKQGHAEWQEGGTVTDSIALAAADTQGKFGYGGTLDDSGAEDIFKITSTANSTDASISGKLAFGCVNLETGKTDISKALLDSGSDDDTSCT